MTNAKTNGPSEGQFCDLAARTTSVVVDAKTDILVLEASRGRFIQI